MHNSLWKMDFGWMLLSLPDHGEALERLLVWTANRQRGMSWNCWMATFEPWS
jgi:hypothetical protein